MTVSASPRTLYPNILTPQPLSVSIVLFYYICVCHVLFCVYLCLCTIVSALQSLSRLKQP